MNLSGRSAEVAGKSSRKLHFYFYIRSYFTNILTILFLAAGLSAAGDMLSDVFDIHNIERYVRAPLLYALNALPLALFMLLLGCQKANVGPW